MNSKIISMRETKTEALLVYIKTICTDYLKKIEKKEYKIDIGNEINNNKILNNILYLKKNLDKNVYDSYELESYISSYTNKYPNKRLPLNIEAIVFYYNNIILEFEKNFTKGDFWIPELVILSLLSEWIYEEEKSIKKYSYLEEIDYFKLISFFEDARNNQKKLNQQKSVLTMFFISSCVIKRLKKAKYKINRNRKSKKRK